MKYKVTAYSLETVLEHRKDKSIFAHRWKKVNSWTADNKALALKFVKIWSKYREPYFKATIQSLKGGRKSVKR